MIYIQLIANSLISGLLLALVAVGFNLIFNTSKVFHIAHGAIYVFGGYIFLWLFESSKMGLFISIIVSLISTVIVAVVIEAVIYKKLTLKNSSQAITLISSMGVYLVIINILVVLFGNESKIVSGFDSKNFDFSGILLTNIQIIQLIVSVLLLILIILFSKTKYFLSIKAVMSNKEVASVLGINSENVRLISICIGSVLAVCACILKLYDTGINPYSGMSITLSAAVVVIFGGAYSFGGTAMAAIILTLLQTLTEYFFSAQWKEGVTFTILIMIILWKTEGIVSFKMRLEEK